VRSRDPSKEEAIRRKAMELAVKEGFDGLSMQKVAKEANVSPGTLYVYFEDREDLVLQVYRSEMEKTQAAMMRGFDPSMRFDEGLRVQWLNRARHCLANPLSMLFLEQFRHTPLHEKALALAGGDFKRIMQEFVQNAIRNGELVRLPLETYWAVAFAPMYQLVKFHLQGKSLPGRGKFTLTEDMLLQSLELVLKALTPSPEEKAKILAASRRDDARADRSDKQSARTRSARTGKSPRKKTP
jgi:AcrR family transcriptional regulator